MSDLKSMLSEFVDVNSMISEVEKGTTRRFWRPAKNKTTVRILPPITANGEKLPWFEHKVHWINGQPYECLNQTIVDKDGNMHTAEPCPICKMAKALYGAKTDASMDLAKKISAKTRYISRVVVRGEDGSNTPVFYELPFSIYNKFKTAILSKEWGSLVGPLDGRDFDINKEGEGMYVKYDSSSFKPMTSPIASNNEEIVEIIKKAKDITYNSLVSFQDAETLKGVAMENDAIASFFGKPNNSYAAVQQTATPAYGSVLKEVSAVAEATPVDNMDDLVPAFSPEPVVEQKPAPQKSNAEDLESLLAGLI